MQRLHNLIASSEDWLMERVLDYAREHDFARYTSTLAEAWRTSITGLSTPFLEALEKNSPISPLKADQDFLSDPLAAFGIHESRLHRERGVDLPLFLSLMKYYRRAYIDLVDQEDISQERRSFYHLLLHNYFDRIEVGFSSGWAMTPDASSMRELQQKNIRVTTEKNKFLTIFESLPNPALFVNQENLVENFNHAASELFFTGNQPGNHYYGGSALTPLPPAIADEVIAFAASEETGLRLEKEVATNEGNGQFIVKMQKMLDISGKFRGCVVILSDITTLKQMEGDIEVLNTNLSERALQLEILNKELEAFNYSVSHDLRAPLTNVMGYSQVLLDIFKEHLPPQCQEIVQGIANQANRMNRLIEALLNLSHISHGELNRQSVDLGEIASGILKGLKANTPERQALFEIAPEMNSNGDLELIYILLNNLIGNAWKYTGRNDSTRIKVGREEQEGKQVFFVRDNGVGFDMEQVGKLFDTFQRLHNRDDFDGNGIGLATAQRIVQRHGGKIWAEGVVDKGATFYFTLD